MSTDLAHLHNPKGRDRTPVPSGLLSATVRSVVSDGVMVIIPSRSHRHLVGPCFTSASLSPGDVVLLGFDEVGDPWVIGVK